MNDDTAQGERARRAAAEWHIDRRHEAWSGTSLHLHRQHILLCKSVKRRSDGAGAPPVARCTLVHGPRGRDGEQLARPRRQRAAARLPLQCQLLQVVCLCLAWSVNCWRKAVRTRASIVRRLGVVRRTGDAARRAKPLPAWKGPHLQELLLHLQAVSS